MWGLFGGGRKDTRPRPVRGLEIAEQVDARGFEQVLISDTRRRQVTAIDVVDGGGLVTDAAVRAWNWQMSSAPRLRTAFVCDGTTGAAPLLGSVFAAETTTERKDLSELRTAVVLGAAERAGAASAAGLSARPATEAELAGRCGHVLGAAVRAVDDLAELEWDEDARAVTVGSTQCSVFTLACADVESAQAAFVDVTEALEAWDVDGQVWRTRWMRPFLDSAAVDDSVGGPGGRVWQTLVTVGGPAVDELFVASLAPLTRIRMQREWGRQAVMVAAALGLGVTGFENTGIEVELD